jgi:hypothetical protein
VLEQARLCGHELPDLVEPERQDDDVCTRDRVFDRSGFGPRSELAREVHSVPLVLRGQDDGFVAGHEMAGDRTPEVADSDDGGCQGDSFPGLRFRPGSSPRRADARIPETRSS